MRRINIARGPSLSGCDGLMTPGGPTRLFLNGYTTGKPRYNRCEASLHDVV